MDSNIGRKNGETTIDTGVDRRLHVYTRPVYEDEAQRNYDEFLLEELEIEAINDKFDEFLSYTNEVYNEFNKRAQNRRS